MENREKLAVDIDDTIIQFLPDFLQWHNRVHKTGFTPKDFTSYRWWETLGVSKQQAYEKAEEYIEHRTRWYGVDLQYAHMEIHFDPEAEKALMFLGKRYECYGITDKSLALEDETFEISSLLYFDELERRGRDGLVLPFDRVHHTRDESGDRIYTKDQVCKKLGITKIIDDNPDVAEECSAVGIQVYMPAKPWNETYPASPTVFRAPWKAICKMLK
ncbi:MAG: hypothetical protein RL557_665 [archaeon]|jgi:hypothetical protein